jgi:hypothetical protein
MDEIERYYMNGFEHRDKSKVNPVRLYKALAEILGQREEIKISIIVMKINKEICNKITIYKDPDYKGL